MRNYTFVRAYFESRREAEAAGLDADQSKGYAVAAARSEVAKLVADLLS